MTSAQKVIKYISIAFAIFLIITIISSIIGALYVVAGIFGLRKEKETSTIDNENITDITEFKNQNIETLEIELAYTSLSIKKGETLKIDTNNDRIKCNQNNNKIKIEDKSNNWFSNHGEKNLTLYIPENLKLDKVKIVAGAGEINIENLISKSLDFELGAGKMQIENINVSNKCDIEGGAGELNILSGTINNLKFDMGVGEANVSANLLEDNEINAGIGSLNINLGNKEDYKIKVNKGIGNVKIDGNEISDGQIIGNGENRIDIDGGIGNIKVKFN